MFNGQLRGSADLQVKTIEINEQDGIESAAMRCEGNDLERTDQGWGPFHFGELVEEHVTVPELVNQV